MVDTRRRHGPPIQADAGAGAEMARGLVEVVLAFEDGLFESTPYRTNEGEANEQQRERRPKDEPPHMRCKPCTPPLYTPPVVVSLGGYTGL